MIEAKYVPLIAIYENTTFFAIFGKTDCIPYFITENNVIFAPINLVISISMITYITLMSIPIFILSFSYTLLINLYLIYSFAINTLPNIHKLCSNPVIVVLYGFFPKVTNNPDNIYTIINTNVAMIVYSIIGFFNFLFSTFFPNKKYKAMERIIQNNGLIMYK